MASRLVVALTADALVENRQRCSEAGMDDFVTKPIRLQDIRACLDRRAGARIPLRSTDGAMGPA